MTGCEITTFLIREPAHPSREVRGQKGLQPGFLGFGGGDSDTWFLLVHRVGDVHSRVLGRTGVQEGLFTTRLGTGEAESLNSWGSRMESLGDSEFWVRGRECARGGLRRSLALTFV